MSEAMQSTMGGAVALLILKEVFTFVRGVIARRNGDGPEGALERLRREYLGPIRHMQQELHQWHDVVDEEGVRLWYGRSLLRPIERLQTGIHEQNEILRDIARSSRDTLEEVRRMVK